MMLSCRIFRSREDTSPWLMRTFTSGRRNTRGTRKYPAVMCTPCESVRATRWGDESGITYIGRSLDYRHTRRAAQKSITSTRTASTIAEAICGSSRIRATPTTATRGSSQTSSALFAARHSGRHAHQVVTAPFGALPCGPITLALGEYCLIARVLHAGRYFDRLITERGTARCRAEAGLAGTCRARRARSRIVGLR